MGRLIDADVMLEELKDKEVVIAQQNIADWINEQPTVDAEPVRYGKWIWMKDHWECSRCRGSRFHDLALGADASFCGRCGAKMDGE